MSRRTSRSITTPDLVVMSVLAEQPRHGYDLVRELLRREVEDWAAVSRPQVYYSLAKLAELGLIKPTRDLDPSAGPERIVYSLTPKAHEALAEGLASEEWATQRVAPPFVTWLVLSEYARATDVARLINRRRTFLDEQLTKERHTLQSIRAEGGPMASVAQSVVLLGIRLFEAERKWLDGLRPQKR
jgi:DNA-binding PadR family transcriptional regulator